jgi:hypothetical protein
LLREAQNLYTQAELFYRKNDYEGARNLAEKSADTAGEARLALIQDAELALIQAKSYGGWTIEDLQSQLTSAAENLHQARVAMDNQQFAQAQSLALASLNRSEQAINATKNEVFRNRFSSDYRIFQEAMRTGAGYFQSAEVKDLIKEFETLQKEYSEEEFDRIASQMNEIHLRVKRLLEHTPEVLNGLAELQHQRLEEFEEAGAYRYATDEMEEARGFLGQAKLNFRKDKFRTAYHNLRAAIAVVDGIQIQIDQRRYDTRITDILGELEAVMSDFKPVLEIKPDILKSIAIGDNGKGRIRAISGGISPQEFTLKVSRLYQQSIFLSPPKHREDAQKRLVSALKAATYAGQNFEKLVVLPELDEYTIRRLIDAAYRFVDISREHQEKLAAEIIDEESTSYILNVGITSALERQQQDLAEE